ncbi:Serine/threonine-protein kinase PknD [Streptomyces sp. CA-256286]|nr:Serine/threonine-protein kinase PknD [Streptomyces sp. CA-256286]
MDRSQGTAAGLVLAGRYRLGEVLGRGGMGKVWRAHDEVLHRTVAVKELTAGLYVAEADRLVLHARTQKEARAAARITHPGVVTVHDVIEYDKRPWIVMQYVDGPSLADQAKESGEIAPREAARIGLHVLSALRAAHGAGVLHRDVKPGNVLLARDGQVLLTDFGIAAIEGDSTITRTGELVGSIDYLAPERVRGGDPGPASDLWSLGATLYTAVEGRSPFRRTSRSPPCRPSSPRNRPRPSTPVPSAPSSPRCSARIRPTAPRPPRPSRCCWTPWRAGSRARPRRTCRPSGCRSSPGSRTPARTAPRPGSPDRPPPRRCRPPPSPAPPPPPSPGAAAPGGGARRSSWSSPPRSSGARPGLPR